MNNMNNMNNMNVSNEHLLLINILNTMYNDNNRQIQNLTDQNNQIINIITDILHVPVSNNRQRDNNRQNNQNNNQNNRQHNRNNNSNNLGNLFSNNRQYIIDDIQRLNLPLNTSVSGTGIVEGRLCGNYRDDSAGRAARNAARDAGTTQSQERINNVFTNLFQNFFDPVIVYPTPSQIEIATRRVLYRDIVSPINSSCPISMDNFNDNDTVTIIRHCGHIFNSDEFTTWFHSNCRCPVCRYDIRNYNSQTTLNHISSRNTSSNNNQERNNNGLMYDNSGNILYTRYGHDASGNSIQW